MTSRRYPARIAVRAREHREAGWPYRRIQDLLHQEYGVRPAVTAIARWADDTRAEHQRKHQRDYARRKRAEAGTFQLAGGKPHSVKYVEAFVRRLKAQGMTSAAIEKACAVVMPNSGVTRHRILVILSDALPQGAGSCVEESPANGDNGASINRGGTALDDPPPAPGVEDLMQREAYTGATA